MAGRKLTWGYLKSWADQNGVSDDAEVVYELDEDRDPLPVRDIDHSEAERGIPEMLLLKRVYAGCCVITRRCCPGRSPGCWPFVKRPGASGPWPGSSRTRRRMFLPWPRSSAQMPSRCGTGWRACTAGRATTRAMGSGCGRRPGAAPAARSRPHRWRSGPASACGKRCRGGLAELLQLLSQLGRLGACCRGAWCHSGRQEFWRTHPGYRAIVRQGPSLVSGRDGPCCLTENPRLRAGPRRCGILAACPESRSGPVHIPPG